MLRDRGPIGRSLDSPPAPPAAGTRGAARSGAWRCSSRGTLSRAARLAGLDEAEAAEAAELLVAAGILEAGRPLTFIHPMVRGGIYSELPAAERAQGHRHAARLLAEQPGASERVAKHLLATEPAGDGWVVERLVETAAGGEATALPRRRRSSCAERSPNHRRRPSGRRCCWTSEWPRRASGSPAGPSTCKVRWTRRQTPRQPPRQPWCWRTRSVALTASGRRSRFSIGHRGALDARLRTRASARGGRRGGRSERPVPATFGRPSW